MMKIKILILLIILPFSIKAQQVLYSNEPIDFNENYYFTPYEREISRIAKFSYSMGVNPLGLAPSVFRNEMGANKNLNEEHFSIGFDISTSTNHTYYFSWGIRYHFYHYVADYGPSYVSGSLSDLESYRSSLNIQYLSLYLGNELYFNKSNLSFGVMLNAKTFNKIKTNYDLVDGEIITEIDFDKKHTEIPRILTISAEIYYGLPTIGAYFQYRITGLNVDNLYDSDNASPFILGIRYSGWSNN